MYQLSNFSSVFEIATAVCLAYGLIKAAFSYPIIEIQNKLERLKITYEKYSIDPDERFIKCLTEAEHGLFAITPLLQKYYNCLAKKSLVCALTPLSILIYSGFNPNSDLNAFCISALLILSYIPVPTLSYLGYRKAQMHLSHLQETIQLLEPIKNEIIDKFLLSKVYNETYQENQQGH
jgi:hypothetical protein